MLIANGSHLVVCSDAEGGLRISASGELDETGCRRLNEAIIAALRSGAPRVEIDLRDAERGDRDMHRVLQAGEALAGHLGVEYRVSGRRAARSD